MFDVIAATLSESLYDHLVLGGILLYIRYTLCGVLFVGGRQPFASFCLTYAVMSHELYRVQLLVLPLLLHHPREQVLQ